MKYVFSLVLLFFFCPGCLAQNSIPISELTVEHWEEDLTYLQRKITKTFATYKPQVISNFNQAIHQLLDSLSYLDSETILMKASRSIARLEDGHTELSVLQSEAGLGRLPILYYYFADGLYIMAAQSSHLNLLGSQVLQIGDVSAEDAFQRLTSFLPHDNIYEIWQTGASALATPAILKFLQIIENKDEVTITLMTSDQKEKKVTIPMINFEAYRTGEWTSLPKYLKVKPLLRDEHSSSYYDFAWLADEKALYIAYNRVQDERGKPSLKKFFAEIFAQIDKQRPDKLIIDLRRNRGGNYKKSAPLIKAIKARPWLNQPGKIYALIGRETFSAAMVTSIFLKQETHAELVGEPSRGHPNKTDNVEYLELPNSGLSVEYTTKVKKHWPELGDATWVPIDWPVEFRSEHYRQGEDPVLEFVLKQ